MNPPEVENAAPAPPKPRVPAYYKPHVVKIIRKLEQSDSVSPPPVTKGESGRLTSREDTTVQPGTQA